MTMTALSLGELRFSAADKVSGTLSLDRLSVEPSSREILAFSVAGPGQRIKAFLAALSAGSKVSFEANDIALECWNRKWTPSGVVLERNAPMEDIGQLVAAEVGYACSRTKLPHGWVHVVGHAKDPRLLLCLNDEELWRVLSGPAFTTPVLRAWVPWIRSELERRLLLLPMFNFGCEVAKHLCDQEQLDDLVSNGVKSGSLVIQ